MNKELCDRLLLLLSTEFFVDYWHHLIGHHFSVEQCATIQEAARAEVDAFLDGEVSFWNIDFSEERQDRSMAGFFRRVNKLDPEALAALKKLASSFCANKQERMNITFAVGFLHRLAKSDEFALETGIASAFRDLIAACIGSSETQLLDTVEVQQRWLRATGDWDRKVRNLTPDLPEYIALDFMECYRTDRELPALIENLNTLVGSGKRKTLIAEVCRALKKQFPSNSDLAVPQILS